jgi:intracellular septation protein
MSMKNPAVKLVLELGPLVVFFITNSKYGIFAATAVLMATTVVSLVVSYVLTRRVPIMPLVTAVCVLVFGGLTLYLQNDTFVKVKPTFINLLFASALGAGLFFNRSLIKIALGEVIHLQDEGWRVLTWRFTGFFIFLAGLNEIVWRSFDTDVWVAFKSFGVMPITFLFMMSQIGLLQRYQLQQEITQPSEK